MNAQSTTTQTLVDELKTLIIRHLNLEDVDPASVNAEEALFGGGLGLDSVDALELVMLMETTYGAKIESSESGRMAFASLNALANFVQTHRKK